MIRTVYNKLLGRWYNVRGPHQTPIGGSYATRDEAKAALNRSRESYASRMERIILNTYGIEGSK